MTTFYEIIVITGAIILLFQVVVLAFYCALMVWAVVEAIAERFFK